MGLLDTFLGVGLLCVALLNGVSAVILLTRPLRAHQSSLPQPAPTARSRITAAVSGGASIAEPRLLASTRLAFAAGLAMIGVSQLLPVSVRTGLLLLIPIVVALLVAAASAVARQRRMNRALTGEDDAIPRDGDNPSGG